MTLLPDNTRIGTVHLRVADLDRSLRFYRDILGYQVTRVDGGSALLTPSLEELAHFLLVERQGVRPKPWRNAGLFHAAIRLPRRGDLARVLRQLGERNWRVDGMSDHGVSEAIYLQDPDSNGLEIYVDRPRDAWPWNGDEVEMVSEPIDMPGLRAELAAEPFPWEGLPPGSDIGHIHLQVSNLDSAEKFYCDLLGFQPMQRTYPGALFVSAGRYHHHLGLNTWAGEGVPPMGKDTAGLIRFDIVLPDQVSLEQATGRLEDSGILVTRTQQAERDDVSRVQALDGVEIELRVQPSQSESSTTPEDLHPKA